MQVRQLWGWSDANPKVSPTARLNLAIRAYEEKHQALPMYCFVHPGMLSQFEGQLGCSVYSAPGMPRNSFYFGLPGDVL